MNYITVGGVTEFDGKTNPDFMRFLYFSISSISEIKSMLYLLERLEYSSSTKVQELTD